MRDQIEIEQKVAGLLAAIRKRRKDLKLTQEYMAYKLKVSQNAYSKIEMGLTRLRIDQLINISYLLSTTAEYFLKMQTATAISA